MNRSRPSRLPLLLALLALALGVASIFVAGPVSRAAGAEPQDAPFHFANPSAVATDRQGNVYVLDQGATLTVDRLSPDGRLLSSWAVRAPGTDPATVRMAVDGSHNVYLLRNARRSGAYAGAITKYSATGRALATWSSPSWLNALGLAARSAGTLYVLVPDRTRQGNPTGRVLTVTPKGKPAGGWHLATAGHDFLEPWGLATDTRGSVYVSGVAGSCSRGCQGGEADVISRLAPSGSKRLATWTYAWGSVVRGPGVAVDNRGDIYAGGDTGFTKISPAGKVLAHWGALGCGPLRFRSIAGLASDGHGNVFILDGFNKNLQKVTTNGEPVALWGGCPSSTPPTPILPAPTATR